MDPISAVLQNFDLTMIKLAGAAVITFVIACVGIKKVAELVSDEGKNDVVINGYEEALNKGIYEDQDDYERIKTEEYKRDYIDQGYFADEDAYADIEDDPSS